MNEQEIAILIRMVKALCPAQRFDEFTPDLWLGVLGEFRFDDAQAALKPLALAQPFIAPTDIAKQVRRTRGERIERFESLAQLIPNAVDGVQSGQELRALRRAIADGYITDQATAEDYRRWGGSLHLAYESSQRPAFLPAPGAQPLRPRPVRQALESVFPAVPPPDLRRALPASGPHRPDLPKWTTVACPTCGALPGDLCVIPETDPLRKRHDPHGARRRAAFPKTGSEAPE